MNERKVNLAQKKKRRVAACNVSNLISTPKDIKLSLEKCSDETKLKSSFFNWLIG